MRKCFIGVLLAFVIAIIGLLTVNVGSASAAMVFHSGFEGGSTFEWGTVTGTLQIQTSIKNTGAYAMRCSSLISTSPAYVENTGSSARGTFYLYVAASTSIETVICGRNSTSSVRITGTDATPNYIKLYDGSTDRGTSTTQLASGTWYRISFARDASGNGAVYINGTQEISTTTLANNFGQRLGIVSTGAATADLYFDDISWESTASTADVGDIHVLLSLPNATGNYSQFDTPVGSSTHYENVDDAPAAISDADYNRQAASAAAYDTYNIQDASTIGIGANDTINAVRYLGRMRRSTGSGGSHRLAVRDNGSDYTTAVSATTSFAWYFRYDATMPNGGAAWTQTRLNSFEVGAYHGTGAQDTYISACMAMVAYTPEENISMPPPKSYDFGLVYEGSTNATGLTYFTVTNNSFDAVNISISGNDMTGGIPWTLSDTATPGVDIYGLMAGTSSYNIIVKKNSPYNNLVQNLAAGATQQWGLQLLAPTSFSDSDNKTSTITLTAIYS